MPATVKTGDRYPIAFTVNADLTAATVRVLARRRGETSATLLPATITDATGGELSHTLTGALTKGTWLIEVEVTRGAEIATFPTAQDGAPQYLTLTVIGDLDPPPASP